MYQRYPRLSAGGIAASVDRRNRVSRSCDVDKRPPTFPKAA